VHQQCYGVLELPEESEWLCDFCSALRVDTILAKMPRAAGAPPRKRRTGVSLVLRSIANEHSIHDLLSVRIDLSMPLVSTHTTSHACILHGRTWSQSSEVHRTMHATLRYTAPCMPLLQHMIHWSIPCARAPPSPPSPRKQETEDCCAEWGCRLQALPYARGSRQGDGADERLDSCVMRNLDARDVV